MPPRRSCILCDYVLKRESLTWCLLSASGDELLLTEMIFNGLFNDLTVEQATALLSCFVFQENVRTHNTTQRSTHKQTLEIPLNSQKQTDTSSSERRRKTDDSRFPHIFRPPTPGRILGLVSRTRRKQKPDFGVCLSGVTRPVALMRPFERLNQAFVWLWISSEQRNKNWPRPERPPSMSFPLNTCFKVWGCWFPSTLLGVCSTNF